MGSDISANCKYMESPSEECFRAAFENSITPLVLLDKQFNFIKVNQAYANACQKDIREFPGKNHFEMYPSDAKAIFEDVIRTSTAFKISARPFEFPDHPEWGVTYWDWSLTPLPDADGEVEFLLFSLNDVTRQKKILNSAEARFRSVLENSIDIIYRMNVQTGHYDYVSPSAETIMGYTPEQYMAMSFEEALAMIHPDDLPAVRAAMERLNESGNEEAIYRQLAKNGEYRWISNQMSLTRDNAGQPLHRNGNIRDITGIKRAEKSLLECESRLRALMTATSDIIYRMSPDWRTMGRLYGHGSLAYTEEQDTCWSDKYIHPEDKWFIMGKINDCIRDKRIFELEHRMLRSDGSIGWVYSRAIPLLDEDGEIIEWFGIANNITGRKQNEDMIQRKNSILQAINQIYEKSVSCQTFSELGQACLDIVNSVTKSKIGFIVEIKEDGLPNEIAVRCRPVVCEILHHPGIAGYIQSVAENKASLLVNTPFPHLGCNGTPAGHIMIDSFLGTPFIRNNKVIGLIGVANRESGYAEEDKELLESITPAILEVLLHRRAVESLSESEQKYRELVKYSPAGIYEVDFMGKRFISVNDTMCQILGYGREELLKMSPLDIMDEQSRSLFQKRFGQWLNGKEPPQSVDYKVMTKDGRELYALLNVRFTRDEHGKPLGATVIAQDITERKCMEIALEKVDKSKNEFISALSHELRNPLAAIKSAASLLDLTDDRQKSDNAIDIIRRQSNQLGRLVDDLLDVSRIIKHKLVIKKEKAVLNEIALHAAEDMRGHFLEKGIILDLDINGDTMYMDGDPVRLSQMIGNLLHNSLKFTEAGGSVGLSIYKEDGSAVIDVYDNGIGIEQEMLSNLFAPFTQSDKSLDRQNGGLGLGLSIVKGIADLHGGSVAAYSEGIGKGARVTVRLPLIAEYREDTTDKRQADDSGKHLKVLVIEDSKDLAEITCELLEYLGHDAEYALTGLKALTRIKELRPDVVICDIGLPDMDGYEVAKSIRNDPGLKDILLIAYSGYARVQDMEKARAAGFDLHLPKPAELSVLDKLLAGHY